MNNINEDIEILEQFLYGNKLTCENCEEKCNECYIEYEEVQAVARLIKGYRELEEREIWSTATINGLKRDFIPKSKIKEFVEENKWYLLETEYHFDSTVVDVDELLKVIED